ncbi:hypothetical protein FPV67DRAFT_1659298 [Lyophyllum atratum]|nr:hypothetical protein FPV67DRAFT_1659298 [Lyophyllum atratum]
MAWLGWSRVKRRRRCSPSESLDAGWRIWAGLASNAALDPLPGRLPTPIGRRGWAGLVSNAALNPLPPSPSTPIGWRGWAGLVSNAALNPLPPSPSTPPNAGWRSWAGLTSNTTLDPLPRRLPNVGLVSTAALSPAQKFKAADGYIPAQPAGIVAKGTHFDAVAFLTAIREFYEKIASQPAESGDYSIEDQADACFTSRETRGRTG